MARSEEPPACIPQPSPPPHHQCPSFLLHHTTTTCYRRTGDASPFVLACLFDFLATPPRKPPCPYLDGAFRAACGTESEGRRWGTRLGTREREREREIYWQSNRYWGSREVRGLVCERVLFIGTQFSILYTSVKYPCGPALSYRGPFLDKYKRDLVQGQKRPRTVRSSALVQRTLSW